MRRRLTLQNESESLAETALLVVWKVINEKTFAESLRVLA